MALAAKVTEALFGPLFRDCGAALGTLSRADIGLTEEDAEEIVRAHAGGHCLQVKDNLDVMNMDASIPINIMRADGGAVVNNFLMQFQADILGIPVDIPEITETTALGAAYLAALGIGEFQSIYDLADHWKLAKRFEPKMSTDERESLLLLASRVERSKNWVKDLTIARAGNSGAVTVYVFSKIWSRISRSKILGKGDLT